MNSHYGVHGIMDFAQDIPKHAWQKWSNLPQAGRIASSIRAADRLAPFIEAERRWDLALAPLQKSVTVPQVRQGRRGKSLLVVLAQVSCLTQVVQLAFVSGQSMLPCVDLRVWKDI